MVCGIYNICKESRNMCCMPLRIYLETLDSALPLNLLGLLAIPQCHFILIKIVSKSSLPGQ